MSTVYVVKWRHTVGTMSGVLGVYHSPEAASKAIRDVGTGQWTFNVEKHKVKS